MLGKGASGTVREGIVREWRTGWEKLGGNSGKTDLNLKEIIFTVSYLASNFDQNTVQTFLPKIGTVKNISLRLKFVFPT